jgi:hypothetical protein
MTEVRVLFVAITAALACAVLFLAIKHWAL